MRSWEDLLANKKLFDTTPQEILDRRAGDAIPLVSTCGLGVNSAAGLILLNRLGDRPDAILFADTGAEQERTYAYLDTLQNWCASVGFPGIITVKRTVDHNRQLREEKYSTLEEECQVKKCLPSIAYYKRSCSIKWKQDPQNIWVNSWATAQAAWDGGGRVVKTIYYDADEPERAKVHSDKKYVYWHPLLCVDWGRDECLEAIALEGLPAPPKSSCFFCSEMTEEEIFDLRDNEPQLLERALRMEANAHLTGIKGLGKHEYSWRDLIDGKVSLPLTGSRVRVPCMCDSGMYEDGTD